MSRLLSGLDAAPTWWGRVGQLIAAIRGIGAGRLIVGNGTAAPTSTAQGAAGQLLAGNGAAAPVWTAAGTSGQVLQSNGDATPTWASITTASSGTYTPTCTAVSNVTTVSAGVAMWTRIGDVVRVSGKMNIDPTSGSLLSAVRLTLPVSSNLAASTDLAGLAIRNTEPLSGWAFGDTTNDAARVDFLCDAVVFAEDWTYEFSYLVI